MTTGKGAMIGHVPTVRVGPQKKIPCRPGTATDIRRNLGITDEEAKAAEKYTKIKAPNER